MCRSVPPHPPRTGDTARVDRPAVRSGRPETGALPWAWERCGAARRRGACEPVPPSEGARRMASSARVPQVAPVGAQRPGWSATSSASDHSSSSTGSRAARDSVERSQRVGLDPPAQPVGGVPHLLSRELERDEGRRPACRAREAGHVDAHARAPRGHPRAQWRLTARSMRELGDHRRRSDDPVAHVHADGDSAHVVSESRRLRNRRRVGPNARRAPRTSAVVAQVGGGGGRCQAARRAGTQESAAGRQAGLGVMRVLARARKRCVRSRRHGGATARHVSSRCRA